ncbi:MAG: Asp-tRNA(Asn)/Glu-tRNA(Gln) amidotransferase subunit GatA [Deltaproteobacteria bacterium]|nr:Asp-tRNA(Asn)/Glu-tRNA(Gln) amidotransferase subunit GatA [Deltaproteobacteria bacterium]
MILELHEKLKSRKLSSVELTRHYLKRIAADRTNSYLTVCEEESLKEATAADARIASGKDVTPLTGIPLGLKDILCTNGVRTTCASKILGDYKPPYDATSVERLKRSGAVTLGKLNMDEFAMGGSNENSAFGAVKNPVNPEYVPGGSSGGSAAAVKAGLAAATLGTDTGGSVRLPAAFTGTVGLKPTYGLVSRYGLVAFASSLDQIGPLGATTEDCAAVLSAIAGHDPLDSTSFKREPADYVALMAAERGKKLRIGVPKEYFVEGIEKAVAEKFSEARKGLEKAGHTFVEISLPHTEYSVAVYYILAVSEASSNLARFDGVRYGMRAKGDLSLTEMYSKTRALFGEEVKRRIILGTFALSAGYYDAYFKKACQVRRLISGDFSEAFKKVDAVMAPTAPSAAFRLGEKIADPLKMYLNDIFTIPVNLAGLPAISTPIGRAAQGLPIGMQFIGRHFEEPRILALSKQVEEEVYREKVDHGF